VDASIAWLDDGAGAAGRPLGWTMARSLLRALPTLAAASATATHATRAGGSVCGVRTLAEGGLGADPRLAAATLRAAVCALTNLTNENPAGCAAIKDHPGGLETAAALVPWCAALEGLIPGAGPSAAERAEAEARAKGGAAGAEGSTRAGRRGGGEKAEKAAGGSGHDMLNAALCLLVNVAELDGEARKALRSLELDAGALEGRRFAPLPRAAGAARASSGGDATGGAGRATRAKEAKKRRAKEAKAALASRPVGLVELLAQMFVRVGGIPGNPEGDHPEGGGGARAGAGEGEGGGAGAGEVTAEMLVDAGEEEEGDGLITQAYSALLAAFLIEGQPALRADVRCAIPEGGLEAMAATLERFRAFHENLESISEDSRVSMNRVIRWLKGGN
jgi:hypothetical protein